MRAIIGRILPVLLPLLLAACAAPATPKPRIVVERDDHDRIIRAEQGQLIEIRLPAAPPGGLRWDIDRLDSTLALEGEPRFEPAVSGAPGNMGTAIFMIRAARPGRAMVRLVYRHPWEQAVKGETFLAMIHVR